MDYITKTGDKAEIAITGAKRDSQEGKHRFDLIGLWFLKRLAALLARGAAHYGERNWEKGQPLSRTYASLLRHAFAIPEDETEDHLAGVGFNAMSMVHTIMEVRAGRLPVELLDLGIYKVQPAPEDSFIVNECPACKTKNDELNIYCGGCGKVLTPF